MDEILNGLRGLNVTYKGTNAADYPSNWRLMDIDEAHAILKDFFLHEAQDMDKGEPFVARYMVGNWDEGEHILVCDVELSTPGSEGRTYYGRGAIRVGHNEFIVDVEGVTGLETLLGNSENGGSNFN